MASLVQKLLCIWHCHIFPDDLFQISGGKNGAGLSGCGILPIGFAHVECSKRHLRSSQRQPGRQRQRQSKDQEKDKDKAFAHMERFQ